MTKGVPDAALAALRDLGLNQLEAEVYLHLLASEAQTAYAVGRALGRPTANVYKAVESLARRGAVLVEEGTARACRAVPVEAFLRQEERAFAARAAAAAERLAGVGSDAPDERVYRIESVDAALGRAREMLARAERVAVVDAFPEALDRVAPWIASAVGRGVEVWVQAYRPVELPGARLVVAATGLRSVEHWQAEQLNVVVDGREALLALMDRELATVRHAIWSESLYLACVAHGGMLSEHTIHRLRRAIESGDGDPKAILEEHPFFVEAPVPGERALYARFAGAPEEGGS